MERQLDVHPIPSEYKVMVDENSHYMDEDERYTAGVFADCAGAIAKCRQIVDEFLAGQFQPGMPAHRLFELYKGFGEDPWISTSMGDCKFSAWTYAEQRCKEICSPIP